MLFSHHHHQHTILVFLSLMVCAGFVVAEWQVFNPDVEDDDIHFMPDASSSSPSSSSSKSSSSSLKKKGNKKSNGRMTLAQKTYQTSPAVDPWAQFQNIAISSNPSQESNDVIKLTSSDKKKTNHNFKSTSYKNTNTSPSSSSDDSSNNKNNNPETDKNIEDNIEQDKEKLKLKSDEKSKYSTLEFRKRELLEDKDYDRELLEDKDYDRELLEDKDYDRDNILKHVQELNGDLEDDNEDVREFGGLIVEDERKLKDRKMEEWGEELDCEDVINTDDIDCLYLQNERHTVADEANMSEAGDKARQQLMDFMIVNNRERRAIGDEGSGSGPTYPEDETIHNGRYNLKRSIRFNNANVTNSTGELTQLLQKKLKAVFGPIKGVENVVVNNVVNTNGVVTADWSLTVRGSGIGAYGGNEVDIANSLQFQLLNLSKPLFDQIELGGANPEEPLDTRDIADTLAGIPNDICGSENPCSTEFDSCRAVGYDEGKCLHKCAILEQARDCEHGGFCEIEKDRDGNTKAVCQCTTNWEGTHCQSRRTLDPGEITGVTIGAAMAVVGLIGTCCWLAVCRRRRKPVNMTYFGDDSDSSERFSNPSSKISTFVIDRPRIRANPIRSFSPHNHDDFSRPSSLSTLPPLMRPREPPNLFSDA